MRVPDVDSYLHMSSSSSSALLTATERADILLLWKGTKVVGEREGQHIPAALEKVRVFKEDDQ